MRAKNIIKSGICILLAGCGSAPYESRGADPAYYAGALTAVGSANGLAFSDGSEVLADAEGTEITVKVARFVTDRNTGETRLVIGDERTTLPIGFSALASRDLTLSLDGETLVFVDGDATDSDGRLFRAYRNLVLTHSGTGGFYSYSRENGGVLEPIDTEGFFAFGHETSPDVLVAKSEEVNYVGNYAGYGQLLTTEGALVSSEIQNVGVLNLTVDFSDSDVAGRLIGRLDPTGDAQDYEMGFIDGPLVWNGIVEKT
ncbi:MAG: hypothetical protein OXQ30_09990, partial [Boseongicola sp.]|nr:hypothetical protein [Boseongicola sp.]